MTAVTEPIPVPDLIIPTGRLRLTTVAEGEATMRIGDNEYLDVIIPAGTSYEIEIGKVYRARWRPSDSPSGIWSFFCQIDEERLWLEADGLSGWTVNHSLAPVEDVTAPSVTQA